MVVTLWLNCRAPSGGWRHLPEAGGLLAQPAWLMDAISTLEAEDRRWRKPAGE